MNANISQILLIPTATVVAALITGFFSIVNLTLNKEQKTSEFRQAWIDGLRTDLATFFSTVRALCRTFQERRSSDISSGDLDALTFSPEKVGDIRLSIADSLYNIKLRMNQNESGHQRLVCLLDEIISKQNRINIEKGTDYKEVFEAIDRAVDHSQLILKTEWTRVKKGEFPFRLIRNWVAPTIFIIGIIGIGLLFYYYIECKI